MHASVGDKIVVHSRHVGERDRHGVILEVHGPDGAPPFVVRWSDGHEDTFVPSADSSIEHVPTPSGDTAQ
ncbi:MAG: DUF1918 domain-containing protein [Actinomycetes bacterium]